MFQELFQQAFHLGGCRVGSMGRNKPVIVTDNILMQNERMAKNALLQGRRMKLISTVVTKSRGSRSAKKMIELVLVIDQLSAVLAGASKAAHINGDANSRKSIRFRCGSELMQTFQHPRRLEAS